jgi:PAS domain S-box-containing protein
MSDTPLSELASTAGPQHVVATLACSHSPVVFYLAALEGACPINWVSPNIEAITGHDPENIVNDDDYFLRLIHSEDVFEADRRIENLRATGVDRREYRLRSADGSYAWFRDELRTAPEDAHDSVVLFGCLLDITAEKHEEQKLHAAEAERERLAGLLSLVIEGSPHGLTVRDADERLLICNRAFSELYDEEPDAFLGKTQEDIGRMFVQRMHQFDGIPVTGSDADLGRWLRRLKSVFDDPVEIELNDGRWLLVTGHCTPEGGFAITRTDITKQKRNELALRESEQRFKHLLESHPLPVWITDLESGRILYESPASAKMFGREWPSEDELNVLDYYADPSTRPHYVEILDEHGEIEGFDILMKKEDGTEFWVSGSSKVLHLEGRKCVMTGMVDLTERMQREEELKRTRETLEDAIESLSEGFALFDRDDRLVLCNTRYRDFHRVSEDIIEPGLNWADLMESDLEKGLYVAAIGREKTWLRDRKTMRRGLQTNLEYEQSDGRWVSGSNMRTRQGGVVVTLTDITDRKLQEAESRRAKEMLEDAIESLGQGFVIWDESDRLMMCNQRYLEINDVCADILEPGVGFEEFIRTGAERGQYLDAVGRVDEWVEEHVNARKRPGSSAEFQLSDGRWIFTRSHATRQGARVAIRLDITDRKKMEEALLESEGLVRRVLESCPVPLAMNRVDSGEYIYISPSNAELLGIDPSEEPFYSPDTYVDPRVREEYVRRLRKEKRIDDLEVQRIRADGTPFWVSMSSRLIEYKGEEMIVSSIFDLTERHAVEEEIARQRQALNQSEKLSALGSLLASVAHELNNPLSIVVAQSMLLEELVSDPEISSRAEKISTAADRCARIVKTFLAMARQQPTDYSTVNVNDIVNAALDVTGYALRSAGVEVTTRLMSDPPSIRGDADQLTQVITNLVLNAQQAMEDMETDRRLKITSSHRPTTGDLIIKVKDSGPGIGSDIRSRIFEPFFTTKKAEAGTGIGLAICHRIIESHGGTISIDDTRGEGASFAIRFPEATRSSDEIPPSEALDDARSVLSVLVIDDESDVLDVLADILRSDGHSVDAAESVEIALKRLREIDYDAVVSDLRMPGVDGSGLYEILKTELPSVIPKLAFLTGDTMSTDVKDFLDESGQPYLEKPINPRELRALVRRLAGRGAR